MAEPSMLCAELANILKWAAAGSHRTVNGAQSMFAKSGKHTLGWQTYSGDGGKAFGMAVRCLRRRAEQLVARRLIRRLVLAPVEMDFLSDIGGQPICQAFHQSPRGIRGAVAILQPSGPAVERHPPGHTPDPLDTA
jgi:hypothetical protein